MKSKVQENKKQKMDRLVASASRLFTETGVEKVSVEEIARQAGVAKGTFYLYFHDKEQLRDLIISREAARLFETADECLRTSPQASFVDAVIFMIDNVLSQLEARATLLKFIRRSLTFAVFHENISGLMQEEQFALYPRFLDLAQSYGWQLKNPYKTLFLVVELASGTCYSCDRQQTLFHERHEAGPVFFHPCDSGKCKKACPASGSANLRSSFAG
ncbi:TetR/AcrR family transcriptional regulator [Faecalibaculum rodentium]|uniref:TetR/AcrR family transcriptional regulator n=1 Tax=Faecalibaculum rodentium TaxID=1702221 RepID=UPI00259BDEF6|nr:TetR/AcrR family transcriptional regulator [Faecalibaculum rodentium]